MSKLNAVAGPGPRYIDPKSPLERQVTTLLALIKDPPENSRVIVITPELAKWIIDNRNDRNRKRKPARIKRYAKMMEGGTDSWVLSGDTIKFGRTGRLLDGQNRLSACFNAQHPFRTHVVFGVDDSAFDVIDSGKPRSGGDTLYTAGAPRSEIVTPAVRWIMILTSETPTDRGRTISNTDILQYWKQLDSERMERAVQWSLEAHKVIPRGNLAACLYLFDEANPREAKRFAADLALMRRSGRKLPDAFEALRKERAGRVHENLRNALIIKAWNVFRSGNTVTMRHLKWSEANEFPTISD